MREGDEIDGKYKVLRKLGAGGMGVVVAARHMQLGEQVAIKILHPRMLEDELAVGRFMREARAAARIKSEYIARVFDVGALPSGAPYMVMEHLEGRDLTSWIAQKGPAPVAQAAEFVLQACAALAEAHTLGIVHRDLKPSNLFCVARPDGRVTIKVLDFGISKLTDAGEFGDGVLTQTTAVMGSPLYMSPEQMRGAKEVSYPADIWGLGVILYELLSGKPPFGGRTMGEIAVNIATAPPPPMAGVRPDVPKGVEAIVLRCLEKSADRRYHDVGELALALAEFAPPQTRTLVESIPGIAARSLKPTSSGRPVAPAPPWAPEAALSPAYLPPSVIRVQARESGGLGSLLFKVVALIALAAIGYKVYHVVENEMNTLQTPE
ncbi:MAG TPA: serine/threonine-protein kinase [Polyangiaceae bacterium]|nr:serine/threonine-protein kinase [Polyangiaceae bacterium]